MSRLPDFLVIGFPRCGTTWLHTCIAEHPEIGVADQKESHFFDKYWERGIDWYTNQFLAQNSAKVIGESTPSYALQNSALSRIASVIPNVKLIVSIRNPVDQVYSNYWFAFKNKLGKHKFMNMSFEDAINKTPLIKRATYIQYFQSILNYFERQQLLVLKYEDFNKKPEKIIREVYKFLEVDTSFTPSNLYRNVNSNIFPKIQAIMKQKKLYWIILILKQIGFDNYIRLIRSKYKNTAYNSMNSSTRKYLENIFAKHNQELEELLDIKLNW